MSTYLSWPFAAVLGIPIAWDILLRKRKYLFFIKWCVISTFTILIPQIALDSDYYGKLSIPAFNIVKYNVLTNAGGPDLYGTEPWTYYLLNGILNFNVAFIAALLVWPLQGLLHLVVALPERSAQYLPISLSQVKPNQDSRKTNRIQQQSYFQLALYLWLSVFWMQPHKEERFLFPIYPLICLAAAMSIDAVQKLWFFAFVKVKVRHYLEHTTWISLVFLGVTSLLSLSRIVAVYQNYHAPMDIWMHINAMSSSPEYEPMLGKNLRFVRFLSRIDILGFQIKMSTSASARNGTDFPRRSLYRANLGNLGFSSQNLMANFRNPLAMSLERPSCTETDSMIKIRRTPPDMSK